MKITRQHETTKISELEGVACTRLLGVGQGGDMGFNVWYILVGDTWFRFFIQHEIIFWTTSDPDPEDDLADRDQYIDVLERIHINDNSIESIEMAQGCLMIGFADGHHLLFRENGDSGGMAVEIY